MLHRIRKVFPIRGPSSATFFSVCSASREIYRLVSVASYLYIYLKPMPGHRAQS